MRNRSNIEQIKKLRAETSASVSDIKFALEDSGGDEKKAREILRKKGLGRATRKAARPTGEGLLFTYLHHSGKVASIVELLCETDFVAKTQDFQNLGKELVLQVASMDPKSLGELGTQEYIRDSSKTVAGLVKETIGKLGENIKIGRIYRMKLGE